VKLKRFLLDISTLTIEGNFKARHLVEEVQAKIIAQKKVDWFEKYMEEKIKNDN